MGPNVAINILIYSLNFVHALFSKKMEEVSTLYGDPGFGFFGDQCTYTLYSDSPSVRLGCIPPHSRAQTTGLLINTCKKDVQIGENEIKRFKLYFLFF